MLWSAIFKRYLMLINAADLMIQVKTVKILLQKQ